MNYQIFKEHFVEDVKRRLYEKGAGDIEITVTQVDKVNESYEALCVYPEEGNMCANFHLENYFATYSEGYHYQSVVAKAVKDIEEFINDVPSFDLDIIRDYGQVKERLSLEVVSAERNAEVLEFVPHKLIEDMAIVYRINLDSGLNASGSVVVNDLMLETYGISLEQLHEDAKRNAAIIKPALIKGMNQTLHEMMSEEELELFGVSDALDEVMYVATVPNKIKGASVLAYDKFMDYAAQKLGGDFFVLPSSLHEIILVKDDGNAQYEALQEMVKDINATEVLPEDKLTDSVYHYDSKNKIFELAEKFEARKNQELTATKGSVIKDLKEKQVASGERSVHAKEDKKPVSKNLGGEVL